MSLSLLQSVVSLPASPFPPLAVGFMGLGTGYLIYGPQELFGYPKRDERVDFATGMWGIWMPGFMQFITGIYLFAGLTLLGTFTAPALYMAALAFTAIRGKTAGPCARGAPDALRPWLAEPIRSSVARQIRRLAYSRRNARAPDISPLTACPRAPPRTSAWDAAWQPLRILRQDCPSRTHGG